MENFPHSELFVALVETPVYPPMTIVYRIHPEKQINDYFDDLVQWLWHEWKVGKYHHQIRNCEIPFYCFLAQCSSATFENLHFSWQHCWQVVVNLHQARIHNCRRITLSVVNHSICLEYCYPQNIKFVLLVSSYSRLQWTSGVCSINQRLLWMEARSNCQIKNSTYISLTTMMPKVSTLTQSIRHVYIPRINDMHLGHLLFWTKKTADFHSLDYSSYFQLTLDGRLFPGKRIHCPQNTSSHLLQNDCFPFPSLEIHPSLFPF